MGDGIEREYRRRRAVPVAYATLVGVTTVIAIKVASTATLSRPTAFDALITAVWLSIGARVALEQWRARTSITADGITVRGSLRTRTWAWADVYDIRVEATKRGSSRWPAYLYGVDGRRALLPHVDEHQLDDPIAEVADLRAAAVQAGLLSAQTRPETEERIRRGDRRRTAWIRAGFATVFVLIAGFALDTWMIFTDRPTHTVLLIAGVPLLCLPVFFLLLDRLGETLAARRPPARS